MDVQISADSVSGSVEVIQSDLPEGSSGERVQAISLHLAREDSGREADVALQHARVALALVV